MKRALALLFPALLLSACETQPPREYYPEYPPPPPSNVPRAAPTHPVTVTTIKPDTRGGTAPKAVADVYMDRQEGDLRRDLRGSGFLVARRGNDIVLNLQSDRLFVPNSVSLSPDGQQMLAALGSTLRYYDQTSIEVDGYTDTSGAPDKNMQVSQKRAAAVAAALEAGGVRPSRIKAQGFGETVLKIPTGDGVNEPRNRRIEIHIAPNGLG